MSRIDEMTFINWEIVQLIQTQQRQRRVTGSRMQADEDDDLQITCEIIANCESQDEQDEWLIKS